MLNIYCEYENYGPGKVVKNLELGLELLKQSYRKNPDISEVNIDNDKFLILQDHPIMQNKDVIKKAIIGPNICVLPFENKTVMEQKYLKHLVPSKWVEDYFSKWIPKEKLQIWPVGINQNKFTPSNTENNTNVSDCLVYFKRRDEVDLAKAVKILKKYKQSFNILFYGQYTEGEFLDKLYSSKYIFLVNGTESQGIAVEEMMSCNKPIFCWDVHKWTDYGDEYIFPATSVPYWDDSIGIKTNLEIELEIKFQEFLDKLLTFTPRKYILENLTLEKQAQDLLNIFNNV